jgi:Zn-dependent protease
VTNFVAFLLAALLLVPALLIAIPVHEMGHAAAAYFLGDRSVRYFGYFSLDPRRFLDPLGVIAVFVALVGWGRRVPVQPNRISTTTQHLIHELGGPAANLLVAIVLGNLWRFVAKMGLHSTLDLSPGLIGSAIFVIVFLNLSIFAFQLLPIPGLDGWAIVEAIFRRRNPRFFFNAYARRQQIWMGCVVVIFLFQLFQGANLLQVVMIPFYWPASLISLGGCAGYGIPGFIGLYPCPPR